MEGLGRQSHGDYVSKSEKKKGLLTFPFSFLSSELDAQNIWDFHDKPPGPSRVAVKRIE